MAAVETMAGVRVLAGIAGADLPGVVAKARRLCFHAAFYSNFARNQAMTDALDTALARPDFRGLDVISLDPGACAPFWDEFSRVLRHDMPEAAMRQEFLVSATFLDGLASRHPGKVRLYLTPSLPLAPILHTHDTVYAGHYLHGPLAAPDGLWLAIAADVEHLLALAAQNAVPADLEPFHRGAYRLILECLAARNAARELT